MSDPFVKRSHSLAKDRRQMPAPDVVPVHRGKRRGEKRKGRPIILWAKYTNKGLWLRNDRTPFAYGYYKTMDGAMQVARKCLRSFVDYYDFTIENKLTGKKTEIKKDECKPVT